MTDTTNGFRHERKFELLHVAPEEVRCLVRSHPAAFREVYPIRLINNVYFDSSDLDAYHDHIAGASRRSKVRLRWYGEGLGEESGQAFLEFKHKVGLLNTKESHPLNGAAPADIIQRDLESLLTGLGDRTERVRLRLASVQPTLINRYRRAYFCSAQTGVRLTLDWGLGFHRFGNTAHEKVREGYHRPGVILELKFNNSQAEDAARISNQWPFRSGRCSKYVLGVRLLGLA